PVRRRPHRPRPRARPDLHDALQRRVATLPAMQYEKSSLAIAIFSAFVGFVLILSFYLGKKARSARGYYAAHGQVGWFINGIAFAGDYLSAASFLCICGMLAFFG